MLQDVSSKPIRDTVDDFVEGLKHFDKVNIVFYFLMSSYPNYIILRRETVSSPQWSSDTYSLGWERR